MKTLNEAAPIETKTPARTNYLIDPNQTVALYLRLGKKAAQGTFGNQEGYCALGVHNLANGRQVSDMGVFRSHGMSPHFASGFVHGFDGGSLGVPSDSLDISDFVDKDYVKGFGNGQACLAAVKAAGLL